MKDFETIDAANLDNVTGGIDLQGIWNGVKEGVRKAVEYVRPYLPQLPFPQLPKKDGAS